MTLYYNLVFALLVFEAALFCSISLPWPLAFQHRYLNFIAKNKVIQTFIYWLKIVFVFVLLLFVDSVNRVYRVQQELRRMSANKGGTAIVTVDRSEIQARRFYAERNMYLCGFTIFLSFVLNSYVGLLTKSTGDRELLEQLQTSNNPAKVTELRKEVKTLQDKLAKATLDVQAMVTQSGNLNAEYQRKMNEEAGSRN